jgi:nitronate monooxygenase
VVCNYEWPEGYTGRALRNPFVERWDGREDDLTASLDTEGLLSERR